MGYIDKSRSIRSQDAIEHYEVPISMINREFIDKFLKVYEYCFRADKHYLKKLPVGIWKFAALQMGRSSWHHTGCYYRKTDHYNMYHVARKLIKEKDTIIEEYKKENSGNTFFYGIINFDVIKNGLLAYKSERVGIIYGEWLYHLTDNKLQRVKVDGNNTNWYMKYNTYREFNKNYPNKKNIQYFNDILKLKF